MSKVKMCDHYKDGDMRDLIKEPLRAACDAQKQLANELFELNQKLISEDCEIPDSNRRKMIDMDVPILDITPIPNL